jgi:hypothetical protein
VRLFCGGGEVILNWEAHFGDLAVRDPVTQRSFEPRGKGFISPNEWHLLVWKFEERHMTVEVDGEVRFQKDGDYRRLEAASAIAPAWGSLVTVDYFVVEKN